MAEAVTMQKVYQELCEIKQHMVSKDELVRLLETWEMLHNPETMQQIHASEEDVRKGRTKTIRSFKDLLAEL